MRILNCALAILLWLPMAWAADVVGTPKSAGIPEQSAPAFTLADSGCGGGAHLADVQCLADYLRSLDGELNRVYRLALNALPEKEPTDERRGRTQLRKSQRAWLQYKSENCSLVGALEGDSNLWVAHFAALCEEKALRERIMFLKSIADDK